MNICLLRNAFVIPFQFNITNLVKELMNNTAKLEIYANEYLIIF